MHPALAAALDAARRDLVATGAALPRVEESDWAGPDQPSLLLSFDGCGSAGASIWLPDPPAEQVVHLVTDVQDWVVEEHARQGRPTNWPPCPKHPATHPLVPRADGDRAVWVCPATGDAIAEVGSLGG